jgi:hypothetical protein
MIRLRKYFKNINHLYCKGTLLILDFRVYNWRRRRYTVTGVGYEG